MDPEASTFSWLYSDDDFPTPLTVEEFSQRGVLSSPVSDYSSWADSYVHCSEADWKLHCGASNLEEVLPPASNSTSAGTEYAQNEGPTIQQAASLAYETETWDSGDQKMGGAEAEAGVRWHQGPPSGPGTSAHSQTTRDQSPPTEASDETEPVVTARRRTHNHVEKRYRGRLNDQFEQLIGLLSANGDDVSRVPARRGPATKRISKAKVLDLAQKRIMELEARQRQMELEQEQLKAQLDRLL